ncbi:transcriptional regulator NrdR [Candidatus Woesearchaeota archaeon]|nr:transcriptional regulator NrdR [Candidatus Woesearchaeota archaeon]
MLCPYCSHSDTRVLDKRETTDSFSTRRRRECLKCRKRFTTYERVEMVELMVIKKDRTRERFNRNKLFQGILRACEKRPVSQQQIERIVDEVEIELRNRDSTEVESRIIGELVMSKLKSIDKVSYIRFASVYREFADLRSFQKELQKLARH